MPLPTPASGPFRRFLRTELLRRTIFTLLVPLLAFSNLVGPRFFAHGHGDHAVHLHPVEFERGKLILNCAERHAHFHPHSDERPPTDDGPADQPPQGVLVVLPQCKSMPVRALDLGLHLAAIAAGPADFLLPSTIYLIQSTGPSRGPPHIGPLTFATAGERLVRTSCALRL